jgi:hypothetical protein
MLRFKIGCDFLTTKTTFIPAVEWMRTLQILHLACTRETLTLKSCNDEIS